MGKIAESNFILNRKSLSNTNIRRIIQRSSYNIFRINIQSIASDTATQTHK